MTLTMEESARRLRLAEMILVSVAVAFVAAASFSALYLMYLDTKVPFQNNVVYTMNASGERQTVFHARDVMLVYRDFCTTRDVSITFTRSLRRTTDRLNVHINTTTGVIKKGCVAGPNFIRLPDAPPGEYEFVNVLTFSNNALQPEQSVELIAPVIEIVK